MSPPGRLPRVAVAVLAALAVLAPVATAAAAPGSGPARPLSAGPGPTAQEGWTVTQAQPEVDNTVTRVAVAANGSARWTVRIRTRLDSDERAAEYRAFQERFRNNTSAFLDPFARRMERVVAAAGNETGREMAAVGFRAATAIQELPRRWGVVTYSFRWTGFARPDGDALAVGDVFQGGFFLAAGDRLQVAAPDGYRVADAAPRPDERSGGVVTWRGRTDFADRRPLARFEPATPAGNATATTDGESGTSGATTAPPTADSPTTGPSAGGGPGLSLAVAAVAVLAAVVAGGYVLRRRGGDPGTGGEVTGASGDGPGVDGAASGDVDAPTPGEPVVTDEERVQRLLGERGGRMRQAELGDELGWSASKTSRVVSEMAENGTVEKLRVGRENLVDLADDDGE